tara:strand:+ start:103 stop:228 length:126 start_codon:yes stop_codon:yes gene_type:complete
MATVNIESDSDSMVYIEDDVDITQVFQNQTEEEIKQKTLEH